MSAKTFALAAGLLLMTVVVYIPATRGEFIWDDDDYVQNNATLRSVEGLQEIWLKPGATQQYYPLVFTTFWLEYQSWDLNPAGYHWTNVVLHGLSAVLLWFVLCRLGLPGAWFAASIFALHPVHVESVAWVTERKNVLAGVFYWSALLAYANFSPLGPDERARDKRWAWYALALVLFGGALLSKTVTCSLPAVLLLLTWWKRGRVTIRDGFALAPLFILGAGLAWVTVWIEKHHVGAEGKDWTLSAVERCLVAGRALWFYASKLVWPVDLTFIYPRWEIDSSVWWQYLFPVAAIGVITLLWGTRARLGRGPLVAVLVFAGTLVPALGFIDVYPMRYSFVADHFQYLASVGLIALATAAATRAWQRLPPKRAWTGVTAGAMILLILGIRSWNQEGAYHDLETLWTDTIRKNPECWMGHYNLGTLYLRDGKLEEAEGQLRAALQFKPSHFDAAVNWGIVKMRQGKLDEAIAHFTSALAMTDVPRELARIHRNLGAALAQQAQWSAAIEHYAAALANDPESARDHFHLGAALVHLEKLTEAEEHLHAALAIDPHLAEAHSELGEVLTAEGRLDEALARFRQAVTLLPRNSEYRVNWAVALYRNGQLTDSVLQRQEAQRLDPDNWPLVFQQAAWTLATHPNAKVRSGALAVDLAREASFATDFRNPRLLDALAAAYAEAGQFAEAVETARLAIRLASQARQTELVKQLQERQALYERGQPFREEA
jgi:tetratricopeptide (TPR) repeat protein